MAELSLTFQIPLLTAALAKEQKGCHARVLDESDVRQFLGSCLALGFIYKMYPALNHDGYTIKTNGGYVSRSPGARTTCMVLSPTPRGRYYINVFRGLAEKTHFNLYKKQHRAEILNREYAREFYSRHTGREILHYIQLKDVPITEDDLSDEKMPLYINIPVLEVYAKERLAGLITQEAL